MRLINGFFAFSTLLVISALLAYPMRFFQSDPFWLAIFFWHWIWFFATRPYEQPVDRLMVTFVLLSLWTPATMATCLVLNCTSGVLPFQVASLLAAVDIAYCIIKIKGSLPQSLCINPRQAISCAATAAPINAISRKDSEKFQ